MLKQLIAIFSFFWFSFGGAAVAADNPQNKVILGLHESLTISELGITLEAKLDTGAKSASLSAYDIKTFKKNGEKWVRFKLGAKHLSDRVVELPVDNTVLIRSRAEEQSENGSTAHRRYVVRLTLCVGGRAVITRVNLADRRHFNYPFLLGSEGLKGLGVLVDSSLEFAASDANCAESNK